MGFTGFYWVFTGFRSRWTANRLLLPATSGAVQHKKRTGTKLSETETKPQKRKKPPPITMMTTNNSNNNNDNDDDDDDDDDAVAVVVVDDDDDE